MREFTSVQQGMNEEQPFPTISLYGLLVSEALNVLKVGNTLVFLFAYQHFAFLFSCLKTSVIQMTMLLVILANFLILKYSAV